jgi:hypothetical protein
MLKSPKQNEELPQKIKSQKENLPAMSRAGFEPTISCAPNVSCETDGIPLAQQGLFDDSLTRFY